MALQVPEADLAQYKGLFPETPYNGKSYLPHDTPKACYAAMISFMDRQVGRLMALLKELDLDDNTVVLFTSDNGTTHLKEQVDAEFFDSVGPLRGLKGQLYEGGIRVPLVARWPGVIRPGTEVTPMVQNLDCAETFLDIAGLPVPDRMQGLSMLPLMRGETPDDWRSSIYYHYYEGEGKVHNVYKHYGVRTERYKLAFFYTLNEWEFYDLEKDPQEMRNEYANPDYAAQVKELKEELARLREQYKVTEDDL